MRGFLINERDTIVDHLKQYRLILNAQHDFMEDHLYLTNLFILHDQVTKYVDQGYQGDVLYLDIFKRPLIRYHLSVLC